jgi:hypothetical protein
MAFFIVTAMKTSNLMYLYLSTKLNVPHTWRLILILTTLSTLDTMNSFKKSTILKFQHSCSAHLNRYSWGTVPGKQRETKPATHSGATIKYQIIRWYRMAFQEKFFIIGDSYKTLIHPDHNINNIFIISWQFNGMQVSTLPLPNYNLRVEHRRRSKAMCWREYLNLRRVLGGWKKLHNEQVHCLYLSQNACWMVKPSRMRWFEDVAWMGI